MARNVLKKPAKALEKAANIGSAAASRDFETALLTMVIGFYHNLPGVYLSKVFHRCEDGPSFRSINGGNTQRIYLSALLHPTAFHFRGDPER